MHVLNFSATHAWDHSREWCSWWLVWRSIHNWDVDNFVYMDTNYLANNHKWGTYFREAIDTQGIVGYMIVIWYSTNGNAVDIPLNTQRIVGDHINTQQIGGAIVIQYSTNRWRRNRYSTNRHRGYRYSTNRRRCNWYSINRRRRDRYSTNRPRRDRYSTNCRRRDRYSTTVLQAEALVGSTWYSTIVGEAIEEWFETQSVINTVWQSAKTLMMVKLIHN